MARNRLVDDDGYLIPSVLQIAWDEATVEEQVELINMIFKLSTGESPMKEFLSQPFSVMVADLSIDPLDRPRMPPFCAGDVE